MSEETNLSPSEDSKIERILDNIKRSPKPNTEEKIQGPADKKVRFNGKEEKMGVAQKTLNKADTNDRMFLLTQHAKYEVTERLDELRKEESLEDGYALYQEYRECINDDFEDHDDFDVGYWVHGDYLKTMHRRKVQSSYWEKFKDSD